MGFSLTVEGAPITVILMAFSVLLQAFNGSEPTRTSIEQQQVVVEVVESLWLCLALQLNIIRVR